MFSWIPFSILREGSVRILDLSSIGTCVIVPVSNASTTSLGTGGMSLTISLLRMGSMKPEQRTTIKWTDEAWSGHK